nr:hypothetical protein [Tanacetum cinerariifolium]
MEYIKKSIDKRSLHKREYDNRVNERQLQTTEEKVNTSYVVDASLVDTESSETELGEQNTKANQGMMHILMMQISYPYMMKSQWPRSSSKNMPRFSSNDMVHSHYLEEAKKKTQERGRNSRPSVMPSAKSQRIANDSKLKSRINNQKSKNWLASKASYITTKTMPIAECSRNSRNFSRHQTFCLLDMSELCR